ncbi:RNA polymerase sigma-70 factor (ECF subfamily) [Fluviicoccus keumensis]|uniref:RNA polymerase sigma-70 factor (ECF subfamily) n=1 Tax=Fluviicoccus keumensis TaxID=1435465 RepID=A0A4Q7ZAR5_9GAMM|nr:RNA polymerase sigma factor [Fluviicoccus keumensis]RZU47005.1 RNA polymerase sigma-70 factor (ECF subfamily) [Fluviicoccus keumensis]
MDRLEPATAFIYGDSSPAPAPINAAMSRIALERFARDISHRALRMAELATRNREAALDIVQDSLLALVSRYADRPESEWAPLFHTVLHSRIMDWKRREARRGKWLVWLRPAEDDPEDNPLLNVPEMVDSNPARLLELASDIGCVQTVLESLPVRQQQAFLLRAWEGLDTAATAAVMDCSESSVKTHYARAVAALRAGLAGQGATP